MSELQPSTPNERDHSRGRAVRLRLAGALIALAAGAAALLVAILLVRSVLA
jgi:hypothetical protein